MSHLVAQPRHGLYPSAVTLADVFPVMWVPAHLTRVALHDGSSAFDPTELTVAAAALALLSGLLADGEDLVGRSGRHINCPEP